MVHIICIIYHGHTFVLIKNKWELSFKKVLIKNQKRSGSVSSPIFSLGCMLNSKMIRQISQNIGKRIQMKFLIW